jgi:hypothetical protein
MGEDLRSLLRAQANHFRRQRGQRSPSGDRPSTLSRPGVVGDPWKPATQFDGGRQFAFFVEGGPDRRGVLLGDHEHRRQDGDEHRGGQAISRAGSGAARAASMASDAAEEASEAAARGLSGGNGLRDA